MRILLSLLLILFLSSNSFGQIDQRIECGIRPPKSLKVPWIMRFTGSFDFESIPEPLKPTKVNFVLEVIDGDLPLSEDDWLIKLKFEEHTISVQSETEYLWSGPHHTGDKYYGSVEFTPLKSGPSSMYVFMAEAVNSKKSFRFQGGIYFQWCFNEDGELLYLGNSLEDSQFRDYDRVFFFNSDSVVIPQVRGPFDHELFSYNIVIKPTPRIGDTSTVYYYMESTKDIYGGLNYRMEGRGIDFSSSPETIDYTLSLHQELVMAYTFIPKARRGINNLLLELSSGETLAEKRNNIQRVSLKLLFNDDSTLHYITPYSLDYVGQHRLPESFPKFYNYYDKSIIIQNTFDDKISEEEE